MAGGGRFCLGDRIGEYRFGCDADTCHSVQYDESGVGVGNSGAGMLPVQQFYQQHGYSGFVDSNNDCYRQGYVIARISELWAVPVYRRYLCVDIVCGVERIIGNAVPYIHAAECDSGLDWFGQNERYGQSGHTGRNCRLGIGLFAANENIPVLVVMRMKKWKIEDG